MASNLEKPHGGHKKKAEKGSASDGRHVVCETGGFADEVVREARRKDQEKQRGREGQRKVRLHHITIA